MRLKPYTYDMSDAERLLWLYVQLYAVELYFVKEEPEPVVAQLGPGSVQRPDVLTPLKYKANMCLYQS